MHPRPVTFALVAALLCAGLLAPLGASAQTGQEPAEPIEVTGNVFNKNGNKVGTFSGALTAVNFGVNRDNQLLTSGVIEGVVDYTAEGKEDLPVPATEFSRVVTTGSGTATGAGEVSAAATCQILDLDIGRIRLDLLGLVIDLAPVHLDITAVTGSGNLLGNLLCALVRLLDSGAGARPTCTIEISAPRVGNPGRRRVRGRRGEARPVPGGPAWAAMARSRVLAGDQDQVIRCTAASRCRADSGRSGPSRPSSGRPPRRRPGPYSGCGGR